MYGLNFQLIYKKRMLYEYDIFRSDDEIGWFFKEIEKLQEALNEFTLK